MCLSQHKQSPRWYHTYACIQFTVDSSESESRKICWMKKETNLLKKGTHSHCVCSFLRKVFFSVDFSTIPCALMLTALNEIRNKVSQILEKNWAGIFGIVMVTGDGFADFLPRVERNHNKYESPAVCALNEFPNQDAIIKKESFCASVNEWLEKSFCCFVWLKFWSLCFLFVYFESVDAEVIEARCRMVGKFNSCHYPHLKICSEFH